MDEVLQKAPVIGAAMDLSHLGAPPVRLSAAGARSQSEWVDFIRDRYDFNDLDRQQLVNGIYAIRKAAAEEALTREMGRLGVITPADRDRLKYLLSDYSEYGQAIRRRAEDQAQKIIATDRAYREQWAADRKDKVYPVANRHQINNELRQDLERRGVWKNKQIADTENQQAKSEAVADFYRMTKISNPETEAAWYFSGPTAKPTCDVCLVVMAGNPYTQKGLIDKLNEVGAMSAESYVVHPHERHMADFRPSRGTMHKDENRDAAKGWARMMGNLQDHTTGVVSEAPAPKAMPKWVSTEMSKVESNALRYRICGGKLWKWASAGAVDDPGTVACETLVEQQRGDWAERVAQEITGGSPLEPGAPFDFVTEGKQAFDVQVRKAGDEARTLSQEQHDARDQYARHHGYTAHTLEVVLDQGEATVWHGEGVGGYAGRERIATVDLATGAVKPAAEKLPWQRAAGEGADVPIGLLDNKEWRQSLTERQRQAFSAWTGQDSGAIRRAQIGEGTSEKAVEHARVMEEALKTAKPDERPVYRGYMGVRREVFDAWCEDGNMELDAFSSASASSDQVLKKYVGKNKGWEMGVCTEIKSGHSGVFIPSDVPVEEEVLLRKGSKYRIISVEERLNPTDPDGMERPYMHMILEEVKP